MMNLRNTLFACLSVAVFFSCNKTTPDTSSSEVTTEVSTETNDSLAMTEMVPKATKTVNTSFAHLVKKQSFKVDPAKAFKSTTEHGMKINIPANTLTDLEGNAVTGEVELSVKEYYTPAEIILGGVTMNYHDGNQIQHFESDGMFTITASQGEKELKVADGKTISLETKRSSAKQGYEFYALENETWAKDASNEIAETSSADKLPVIEKPVSPHIPSPLVKFNPNYYTLENDERNVIPGQKSTSHTRELVTQINLDINENRWILNRKNWRFGNKNSAYSSTYILRKIDGEKSKFDTIPFETSYAVRGNKKYSKYVELQAKYDNDLEAYEANYTARLNAGQLTNTEMQQIQIAKMGTYNIDRYLSFPPQLLVEKEFSIHEPKDLLASANIFLVAKGKDDKIYPVDLTVYTNELRFLKTEENALIVLQGDKIYRLNNEDFNSVTKSQIQQKRFDFEMTELNFADVKDFDKAIATLF